MVERLVQLTATNAMTFYMGRGRRGGYVPGKDPVVDDVMRSWQSRYCSFSDAKICVSTFNVNGRSAPSFLPGWFPEGKTPDFFVIGLQEMDLSVGTYIIDNTKREEEWIECIRRSLPDSNNYSVIKSQRLVGIYIIMFKLVTSSIKISEEKSNLIATGISLMGSKLGNKGGTGISLKMNDTQVCFVNCHLAAGNGELERRNQDFRDISNLTFPPGNLSIWDHDVVFWFGDLNYRMANDIPKTNEEIRAIVSGNRFADLFSYDQLYREQRKGTVFVGFEEACPVPFRPTYKYDVGTNRWDSSEKARAPAWCDRILWRTRDSDTHVVQTSYESVESVIISDHKPVRASFQLTLRLIDQKKADKLYEEAIREADRRANELLPQISLSATEMDFGEVFYLEPCCKTVTVKNTGSSTVKLNFLPRPNNSRICASWIQVTPTHYTLPKGQQVQISLTVVVDKKSSWELFAARDERMNDILVMNLENGRDYFIPVSAKYVPRVYGVSLAQLMSNSKRKEENLIDFGDGASSSGSEAPEGIPREIYRLISGLGKFGHNQLDVDEVVDNSIFGRIRIALEKDMPQNLTLLPEITPFGLYSALLRLIDSLTEPIIPPAHKESFLMFCTNPARLWNEVSQMPHINAAIIEYITTYLRELISVRGNVREQLSVWADVLFRDSSPPGLPRHQAILSMVNYARDVSIFHTSATASNLSTMAPSLAPPPRPSRTGSNLF